MIVERQSRRAVQAAKENSRRLYDGALTDEELALLGSMMHSNAEISMVIPGDADPSFVVQQLEVACKVYLFNRRSLNRLKPIIGRLLVWFEEDPQRYMALGYPTMDGFILRFMQERVGIPRSESYDAKRLVAAFPSLTVDQFEKIGPGKLRLIARISTDTQPLRRALLQKAESMTKEAFEDYVAETSLVTKDQQQYCSFEVRCTVDVRKRWKAFVANPEIQAYCQSDNEAVILDLLMSECEMEWLQTDDEDRCVEADGV